MPFRCRAIPGLAVCGFILNQTAKLVVGAQSARCAWLSVVKARRYGSSV